MEKTILGMIQEQEAALEACQHQLREARARLDMIAVTLGFEHKPRVRKEPAELTETSGPYPSLSPAELDRVALSSMYGKDVRPITADDL